MKMIHLLLAAVLLMGVTFAIDNADVTVVSEGRYTNSPATPGSDTTEAGNVTAVNITANVSTGKWAGYYGNVTGSIVLSESDFASRMYSWSWSSATGGEVCVSTDNTPTWSALADTTAATVDTVWSFDASDTDSATNTYSGTTAWSIAGTSGNAPSVTLVNPNIATYVIADAAAPASTNDLLFCSNIDTTDGNYGIMAPAATGGSTTTYYFYVELE